jgi:hypothetical protein
MANQKDFFVSYTSTDRPWAVWIAWQLEAGGYRVVVQAWDFGAGSDWAHGMHNAMSAAERVVVVLSPDYLRSAHGEAEWRHYYAQDPSGERGLMLPVRIHQVDPPGLLRTRVYVDLVGLGAAGAREALLAAARKSRGKPSDEPEFPGRRQQPGIESQQAPRFPGESPPAEGHAGRLSSPGPGSSRFSDLVYALGRAIANPATICHISERAGLNCGDLESGFLTATERWHAALKLAAESGVEEELCNEAVRASANRRLHAAVAAYLSR